MSSCAHKGSGTKTPISPTQGNIKVTTPLRPCCERTEALRPTPGNRTSRSHLWGLAWKYHKHGRNNTLFAPGAKFGESCVLYALSLNSRYCQLCIHQLYSQTTTTHTTSPQTHSPPNLKMRFVLFALFSELSANQIPILGLHTQTG